MKKRARIVLFSFLMTYSYAVTCQTLTESLPSKKGTKMIRPRYLMAGSATSHIKLRDTGTSPRFFGGLGVGGSIGLYAEDSLKATFVMADFSLATLDDAGRVFIVQWEGPTFTILAGTLWKLKIPPLRKLQLGIGPGMRSFTMLRSNDSFLNAGFGVDNVNSLGANFGFFLPFERSQATTRKILGINICQNPRKYSLSFIFHAPIVAISAKPEYAYLTNVVGPNISSYDTYNWGIGGYAIHMDSYLTYYLYNGNALRLRYAWTAVGLSDVFSLNVAQHTFGLIFMFRFNPINNDERY